MNRRLTRALVSTALLLGLALAAPLLADHHGGVTLTGKLMCAKCTLKADGVTECQDVVVVAGEGGADTVYYLTANDAAKSTGHTCKGEKAVEVHGTVSEQDGKTWITAESIKVL